MATQHYMALYDHALFHVVGMLGPVVSEKNGVKLGWADVKHDVRYLHELVAGDLVVIKSAFLRIGRSSLTHRSFMLRSQDGNVCSTLDAVTVRFDLTSRKAVAIDRKRVAAARSLTMPTATQQSSISKLVG